MKDRQLPDTPWHIGYTKKKEADPRRHKARCIFYKKDKTCKCMRSPYYKLKCGGSAHCMFYEEAAEPGTEKEEEVKRIEEENRRAKSIEEEAAERAYRYRQKKIAQRKKLESELGEDILKRKYRDTRDCPICSEIFTEKGGIKQCPYCGLTIHL